MYEDELKEISTLISQINIKSGEFCEVNNVEIKNERHFQHIFYKCLTEEIKNTNYEEILPFSIPEFKTSAKLDTVGKKSGKIYQIDYYYTPDFVISYKHLIIGIELKDTESFRYPSDRFLKQQMAMKYLVNNHFFDEFFLLRVKESKYKQVLGNPSALEQIREREIEPIYPDHEDFKWDLIRERVKCLFGKDRAQIYLTQVKNVNFQLKFEFTGVRDVNFYLNRKSNLVKKYSISSYVKTPVRYIARELFELILEMNFHWLEKYLSLINYYIRNSIR